MKNKTGLVTHISRTNFVLLQNKIKIHHIAYQDLLNTVRLNSSKYKHRRIMTVNFTGKIHNKDHNRHKDVIYYCEIRTFW